MTTRTRVPDAIVPVGLLCGALTLASLIPVAAGRSIPIPLPLGLLAGTGAVGGLAVAAAAALAVLDDRGRLGERIEGLALWAACFVAAAGAIAGVSATAETLDLENIVLAQHNTSLYVTLQPVAAWIYVVAVALAGHEAPVRALLGPASRLRSLALVALAIVLSALGATLFLGGFAGDRLPGPAWLALKTLAVGLVLLVVHRWLRRLAVPAALSIAWAAAGASLLSLVVTWLRELP